MSTTFLAALRRFAKDHAEQNGPALADFVTAYFHSADPKELAARSPEQLIASACAHLRLLDLPANANGVRIRVFNPNIDTDGFGSDHTIVQIIQRDMPFLVNSVTMAINRAGYTVHWIVHPLLVLKRNAEQQLQGVRRALPDGAGNEAVDSFISLECDRIMVAAERSALQADLAAVLSDVGAAVKDWPAMLERLQESIDASCQLAPHSEATSEGIAFLRWLKEQHFTFLGARDYALERRGEGVYLNAIEASGLGILRGPARTPVAQLPAQALPLLASDQLVFATKAMTRSTVHRPAWLDCLSIKRFDAAGQVTGETRLLGLYTARAYAAAVADIPHLRLRAAQVMRAAEVVPDSHDAKSLQAVLEAYPRDELLQIDSTTLINHASGILRLTECQRTSVFLRHDPFGRFTTALVYILRDRYNTELRLRIGEELMRSLDGQAVEYTPMLTDHPMARIFYLIRSSQTPTAAPDIADLTARIASLARRWEDDCKQALLQSHGEQLGLALAARFGNGFSASYKDNFPAAMGAYDALVLSSLSDTVKLRVNLYQAITPMDCNVRLKIYSRTKLALSDSLPILECMGARVLDEQSYLVSASETGCNFWIHDLGLQLPSKISPATIKQRFEQLFLDVWQHQLDNDKLNQLVLTTDLNGRSISILRAYTRYFRQLGFTFSQSYIEDTLCRNPGLTQLLFDLFDARFNPEFETERAALQSRFESQIDSLLNQVASLEEDRVLRQFYCSIKATMRSNAWQTTAEGSFKPYLSFKLEPKKIPGLPNPRPEHEIWVYSPRFEAVHLRHGKVARGGIRWSDRREDFRTEILGLVKAQHVKNTVIVPVGSKGGFVLKAAPDSKQREAWLAEGVACYQLFLSGLLDLTDNLVQGRLIAPMQVVRHDADDPYLVVAADKGTASFSDIANSLSAAYGYWLGDAFASGGSVGYDHKKMAITARGAWESCRRHFRALGIDTQTMPFSVVGIGDMSGDVFGNGMLLSRQIRLLAAFDHRHIFIDPNPDCEKSFAERQRLFALANSSWDDYDKTLLSNGGGVYQRCAKSIKLSAQARAALGIEAGDLTPAQLLAAVLKAPVDLLYNGGIGTYVKASTESHADVGDKASDAFRINGNELRCKVVVEGGNLGCTQKGRIEYARQGGLIYTDAIDNSAGVDCSDHEVNIKILLDRLLEAGDMTAKQRKDLLADMTDEVGQLVLQDNYCQTQALDLACHQATYLLTAQQSLLQQLEASGKLDRALEFLPSDDDIQLRRNAKTGLSAPENAVLLAYAKIALYDDLIASDLPDDIFFESALQAYFPRLLTQKFGAAVALHPLKREIIATCVSNRVVNRMGASFVHFLASETVSSSAAVVRAYTLAQEIFALESLWQQISALDGQLPSTVQLDLLAQLMSLSKHASRALLRRHDKGIDLPSLLQRYQPGAAELRQRLHDWLPQATQHSWQQMHQKWLAAGVAAELAQDLTALKFVFPVLDLVDLTAKTEVTLEQAVKTYFALVAQLELASWQAQIKRLPTQTLWQTQARSSARDDINAIAARITQTVLLHHGSLSDWTKQHAGAIERLHQLLQNVSSQAPDLAPITVALRELQQLV